MYIRMFCTTSGRVCMYIFEYKVLTQMSTIRKKKPGRYVCTCTEGNNEITSKIKTASACGLEEIGPEPT